MKQTTPVEVGLAVVDVDRMLSFYTQALGCTEERRADIPAALSAPLAMADDGYLCIWLVTPVGERIKLMRPTQTPEQDSTPAYLTARTGFAYLTFYCSDLNETLERAEQAGARLRSDRSLFGSDQPVQLCFFEDPEGNVIELVQTQSGERV
ncbi:MAG: VOC family protein [Pseudomonadaceae bacterium]|nr:VOC family protein [Pseudomonadaceae bacterium]